MARYELTTTLTADPDALFARLSETARLPEHVSEVTGAEPVGPAHTGDVPDGDARLRVAADVGGVRRVAEVRMATDPAGRAAVWRTLGPGGHRGRLYVTDAAPGDVRVTVTVETGGPDDPRLRAALDHALGALHRRYRPQARRRRSLRTDRWPAPVNGGRATHRAVVSG